MKILEVQKKSFEKEIAMLQLEQSRLLRELKVEISPKRRATLKAELDKVQLRLASRRDSVRALKAKLKPFAAKQLDKGVRTK